MSTNGLGARTSWKNHSAKFWTSQLVLRSTEYSNLFFFENNTFSNTKVWTLPHTKPSPRPVYVVSNSKFSVSVSSQLQCARCLSVSLSPVWRLVKNNLFRNSAGAFWKCDCVELWLKPYLYPSSIVPTALLGGLLRRVIVHITVHPAVCDMPSAYAPRKVVWMSSHIPSEMQFVSVRRKVVWDPRGGITFGCERREMASKFRTNQFVQKTHRAHGDAGTTDREIPAVISEIVRVLLGRIIENWCLMEGIKCVKALLLLFYGNCLPIAWDIYIEDLLFNLWKDLLFHYWFCCSISEDVCEHFE